MKLAVIACLATAFALDVAPARAGGADSQQKERCRKVQGQWSSGPAPECTSPVGMCTVGELRGGLRGRYEFTMAALLPAADETIPAVHFYTGVSDIDTRRGALVGTDAGTIDLNPFGLGQLVSLINITDGTGRYEGARGTLQIRGSLSFATGEATGDYQGTICVPRRRYRTKRHHDTDD